MATDSERAPRRWLKVAGALLAVMACFVVGIAVGALLDGPVSERLNPGPGVSECGTAPPVVRPRTITVTCADGGEVARSIVWTHWGDGLAVGLATMSVNNCIPSCAEGSQIGYAAKVLLDQPTQTAAGTQFARMVVVYQDRSPNEDDGMVDVMPLALYPTDG